MAGIYCIINLINNKIYVGSTGLSQGFYKRNRYHIYCLKRNKHHNEYLQRSWNKYGEDNFEFRILEECSDDMLIIREQSWINYYDSMNKEKGYNLKDAGNRIKYTKEHRSKISNALTGIKRSEEFCKNLSISRTGSKNPMFGYKYSKKQLKLMSLRSIGNKSCTGRKLSEDHKQKLIQSRIGKKHTEETKEKMRTAWQFRRLSGERETK